MRDWRHDANIALKDLHTMLKSQTKVSDVPQYVIARLSDNLPRSIDADMTTEHLLAIVRAAFYAINDVDFTNENDPVVEQLWKLRSALNVDESPPS